MDIVERLRDPEQGLTSSDRFHLHKDAAATIELQRAVLVLAKEKLEIYWRARPSHEYTGGMEYSHLMHEIEAALGAGHEQSAAKE